jgi:hypothetical protein
LVGTNITGTASGLTAGNVTTNANLTGAVTSVGNATSLGSFTSSQLAGALTDETGSGSAVFATSPTLVTPILGTPTSATLTNATGLPIGTGVSGLGTGIATALAVNTGSAGAPVLFNGALGTPSSGTVTNLTGTASININGTVGATTATTGAFTTLTTSSTVTHNGGTANGVTYLNGSKVLTSGSALTFDGASLGLTTNGSSYGWTNSGNNVAVNAASGVLDFYTGTAAYNKRYTLAADGTAIWTIGSEQMRLTSTGLGIGTSSPATKLDIRGTSTIFRIGSDSNDIGTIQFFNTTGSTINSTISGNLESGNAGGDLRFATKLVAGSLTERMRIDASGNLGIGATTNLTAKLNFPSADSGEVINIYSNSVEAGRSGIGKYSGETRYYNGTGDIFAWRTSGPSGTEIMRLTSAGNLGLGVTPSAWGSSIKAIQMGFAGSTAISGRTDAFQANFTQNAYDTGSNTWVYLQSTTALRYSQVSGQHQWYNAPSGTAGNAITFTQAMTLDASGNLLVGVTSGNNKFTIGGYTTSQQIAEIYASKSGSVSTNIGSGAAIQLANSTSAKSVLIQGADDVLQFWSNGGSWNERARIDSSGRLLVGLTSANTSGANFQVSQGVTFPATQSASSDANTLDDYEEGTWTPAQGSGLTVVGAFSSSGKYTKVGRLVNIQGSVSGATSVSVNAVGIITGNLPFSSVGGFTGIAVNAALTSSVGTTCSLLDLYSTGTIAATTSITFSITYTA